MLDYNRWILNVKEEDLKSELRLISGNDKEIEDRFYKDLSFGTGGLRGILGVGTNRMNIYTVGKATLGLAAYLKEIYHNEPQISVVIAYDSRKKSEEFARITAEVLSSQQIKTCLFSEITPTPVLSFAVRYLKANAGIVITASHNPKEYNGYKVYNENGCQITDNAAKAITAKINEVEYFSTYTPREELITYLNNTVERAFLDEIKKYSLYEIPKKSNLSIVYSPLHGTGRKYVPTILKEIGITQLFIVEEQDVPDGNFPTVASPNPEEKSALKMAIEKAVKCKADMVMATDPDADRIGIAVPNKNGEYVLLNGNETGSILLYYMLQQKKAQNALTLDATTVKTIVTTDAIFAMAEDFKINVKEVLTGFKYIGEAMDSLPDFVLGLEESYGYLIGQHARDKDAVSTAMMIAEAAAYFKERGLSLLDVLEEVSKRYGYYKTELKSISLYGKDGVAIMQKILADIRSNPLKEYQGQTLGFTDFNQGVMGLPKSNVLRFMSCDYKIIIRPSGTEPKMKMYLQVRDKDKQSSEKKLKELTAFAVDWISDIEQRSKKGE